MVLLTAAQALNHRDLSQGYVDATQPNKETNFCFDLLRRIGWEDVPLVLGPHALCVTVPAVPIARDQYHCSNKKRHRHSYGGPQTLESAGQIKLTWD